jgi:hypothetical protein
MKHRCPVWFGLVALLIVVVGLVHPGIYWRAIGWIRGEAFYNGRPTSYWHAQLDQYEEVWAHCWGQIHVLRPKNTKFEILVQSIFGIKLDDRGYALWDGDPQAIPVLLELLKYPDCKSRRVAATGLSNVGPPAENASPLLIEIAQSSPEYPLYKCAFYALLIIGREPGTEIPKRPDLTATRDLMP